MSSSVSLFLLFKKKIFLDVDHFQVFIEFVTILLLFHVLVSWPRGMWDPSSQTKVWTCTLALEGKVLTTGPPRKSPYSTFWGCLWFSSAQLSRSVVSNSLRLHELQHTRPPCPSPTLRVYSNPCPSSQWCHPAISSSVVPFSSCPQSLPASGSFPTSQLFTWGG